jgi:hypothetical protein
MGFKGFMTHFSSKGQEELPDLPFPQVQGCTNPDDRKSEQLNFVWWHQYLWVVSMEIAPGQLSSA